MSIFDEKRKLFLCECNSPNHQMIWSWWPEDEDKTLYITVHLSTWKSLPRRLWCAFLYVIGRSGLFGDWDEILISPHIAKEMRDYLNDFLEGEECHSTH